MQHNLHRLVFTVVIGGAVLAAGAPAIVLAQPYRNDPPPSKQVPPGVRQAALPANPAGKDPVAKDAAGTDQEWRAGAPTAQITPKAPFQLTPAEESAVDAVLQTWEQKSKDIQRFKCDFKRWEYDMAFGDPKQKFLKSEADGTIKYRSPDHGMFRITAMKDVVLQDKEPAKMVEHSSKELEYWVCDGDSIYEYDYKASKLRQHKLPPDMRGKAISDGPLPFVFGAKADQIKKRYFLRLITPQQNVGKEVWLEAWPRFQVDAANFQRVWIVLSVPDYVPQALQLFTPGQATKTPLESSRQAYFFSHQTVNDPLSILKGDFLPPMTPIGWTKEVDDPSAAPADPPPPEKNGQAARPTTPVRR